MVYNGHGTRKTPDGEDTKRLIIPGAHAFVIRIAIPSVRRLIYAEIRFLSPAISLPEVTRARRSERPA